MLTVLCFIFLLVLGGLIAWCDPRGIELSFKPLWRAGRVILFELGRAFVLVLGFALLLKVFSLFQAVIVILLSCLVYFTWKLGKSPNLFKR